MKKVTKDPKPIIPAQISKMIEEWRGENPENRAIIVIAIEEDEDTKIQRMNNYINGKKFLLLDAFIQTLDSTDNDNNCAIIMRKAVALHALQRNMEKLESSLDELQAMLKERMGDSEETESETKDEKEDK